MWGAWLAWPFMLLRKLAIYQLLQDHLSLFDIPFASQARISNLPAIFHRSSAALPITHLEPRFT